MTENKIKQLCDFAKVCLRYLDCLKESDYSCVYQLRTQISKVNYFALLIQ